MDVVKTLRPGRNYTRRYLKRYGHNLLAVRYRLDSEKSISAAFERRSVLLKTRNDTARQQQSQRPVLLRVPRRGPVKPEIAQPASYSNCFLHLSGRDFLRPLISR